LRPSAAVLALLVAASAPLLSSSAARPEPEPAAAIGPSQWRAAGAAGFQETTAVPQAAGTDAAAAALASARELIERGRPAEAIASLETLDQSDPRVAELLGVAWYHRDDHARAIQLLSPLVNRFAAESLEARETVQVLGLSYYLAGRLGDAIPLLEQTREWAADNLELAQVLGMAYIQTRQPDRARTAFARAFGVGEASAAAHLLAAQMMVRVEFHEMADAELHKALALDARLPHANLLLAQNAIFRNRLDEGIAYLQKELALNPANAMALYRLGEAYSRQPDWDKAIAALQQSLWINPYFSGPYIVLGRAYMAKGQPSTAEGMLRRAVEYDPNNKAARYLFGQVLQRLGRAQEAQQQLEIAARLHDGAK
jgi:tetratricopeptide (TPR) repeat protein